MQVSGIESEVLTACLALTVDIEQTPEPDEDDHWACRDLEDERGYGPRYRPRYWFSGGNAIPRKWQGRYLAAVYSLERRGLVETFSEGGRLANVKLTPAGRIQAEQLKEADDE